MTTIAWDGKVLAADKQASSGGLIQTTTKIFKKSTGFYGITGDLSAGLELMQWITEHDARPELFPKFEEDHRGVVLHINPRAEIWLYEGIGPVPFKIEDKWYAIGSGREYAIAALHCGKTAISAVEIAGRYDPHTGRGIDWFELKDFK